ncbi:MAG: hypothetical protein NVSMB18_12030 [Acetobacteraceae bacterium]
MATGMNGRLSSMRDIEASFAALPKFALSAPVATRATQIDAVVAALEWPALVRSALVRSAAWSAATAFG